MGTVKNHMGELQASKISVLQNLEKRIDHIIESGYAELIKEVEESRKRILNITICNSERLGQTLMKEIKTMKAYMVEDNPPIKPIKKKSLKRRHCNKDYENDSVDMVIQPDLPPLLEDDILDQPMNVEEKPFDMERDAGDFFQHFLSFGTDSNDLQQSYNAQATVEANPSNLSENESKPQQDTNDHAVSEWMSKKPPVETAEDQSRVEKRKIPSVGNSSRCPSISELKTPTYTSIYPSSHFRADTTPNQGKNELSNNRIILSELSSEVNQANEEEIKQDKSIYMSTNVLPNITDDGRKVYQCSHCIYQSEHADHFTVHMSAIHRIPPNVVPSKEQNGHPATVHGGSKETAMNLKHNIMQFLNDKNGNAPGNYNLNDTTETLNTTLDSSIGVGVQDTTPFDYTSLDNITDVDSPSVTKDKLCSVKRTPSFKGKNRHIKTNQKKSLPPLPERTTDVMQLIFLKNVLKYNVMRHQYAWPFNMPVDPVKLQLPDYFHIVKTPMDFGTVKQKLQDNVYKKPQECINDINLVFSNCYTYNKPESDVTSMAKALEQVFCEQLLKMPGGN